MDDVMNSERRNEGLTRREFMRKAGAAAAAAAAASVSTRAAGITKSANERLGIGVIGCGGRGGGHLRVLKWMKDNGDNIDIVAVSDVYRPRMQRAAEGYGAKGYMDHKELLADANVDIITVATPDHHHGYQVIDAVKAGKGVYAEKPITHWRQFDLLKRMTEDVKKSGETFQLGSQGMSDSAWHQMKRLVKDGLIGKPLVAEGRSVEKAEAMPAPSGPTWIEASLPPSEMTGIMMEVVLPNRVVLRLGSGCEKSLLRNVVATLSASC